jgi:phosphoribosylpyrophosphate synthetase
MNHIVVTDMVGNYGRNIANELGCPFLPVETVKYKAGEVKPVLRFKDEKRPWISDVVPEDLHGKNAIIALRDHRLYPGADAYLRKNYLTLAALRKVAYESDIQLSGFDLFMPYLYYARQDRAAFGEPPSLEDVGEEIVEKGIDRLFTYNSHIYGRDDNDLGSYFDIYANTPSVHDISLAPLFVEKLKTDYCVGDIVIVTPDGDSMSRVAEFFEECDNFGIDHDFGYVIQQRREDGTKVVIDSDLPVEDKIVLIVDDLSDSGGTVIRAIEETMEHGPKRIFAAVTHIFDEEPIMRLAEKKENNSLSLIMTSDSFYLTRDEERASVFIENFRELNTTEFIADYIKKCDEESKEW